MTVCCLVRHGSYALLDHALGGRAAHALDTMGEAQAESLARRLAARPVRAVLSSPVMRARMTAIPIAAALSLNVIIEPDFAEIDFGRWDGATFALLATDPAWRAWNVFRSIAPTPGGETMLAVQARAVAALLRAVKAYPEDEVVIVSHADIIKAILGHILGAPLDLLRRLEISPGSMSRVRLYADDARVLDVNML